VSRGPDRCRAGRAGIRSGVSSVGQRPDDRARARAERRRSSRVRAVDPRLDEREQLIGFLRDVAEAGAFSEDIEPDAGPLFGSFAQAYTHVGLIHAAIRSARCWDARDGRVRAWI
jgi:hypothetical protein